MRVINFEDYVANELARASSTRDRDRLRWTTLILGELTCVALLVSLFTKRWWGVAAVLGVAALLSGLAYVQRRKAYEENKGTRRQLRAGLRGQQLLPQILEPLDDCYYLLNYVELPGRNDDVDHVVVGPNGVFALETKHHRGRITWQDGEWFQQKVSRRGNLQPEEPIRDPVRQLKRNVDYMRTCINNTDPELSRQASLWIEGAVVFTHPGVSIDLDDALVSRLPFPVMRGRDLPAHIVAHKPRRPYSRAQVRQIVSLFAHLKAPNRH